MQQVTGNAPTNPYRSMATLYKPTNEKTRDGAKVYLAFILATKQAQSGSQPKIVIKVAKIRGDTRALLQDQLEPIGVDRIYVKPTPRTDSGVGMLRASDTDRERKCLSQYLPQNKWLTFLQGIMQGSPDSIQFLKGNIEITHVQQF